MSADPSTASPTGPALAVATARRAQRGWAALPVRDRVRLLGDLRHRVAADAEELADAIDRDPSETLTSEIMPLAEALRFLERRAERLLAPRRPGADGRPAWLAGVELEIHRRPLGVVLIVGPSNYPFFLAAAQVVQALAAGNAAIVKPGRGGRAALGRLAVLAADAGIDPQLVPVLGESPGEARAAIAAGVDHVVLTGSSATGREVLAELAPRLVPATLELSGEDAVFVRADADLERTAAALAFGRRLNGGNTCIAPKRVLVAAQRRSELVSRVEALAPGAAAELSFVAVESDDEALREASRSPYALGASVFSRDLEAARQLAARIPAGVVTVNDLIVPTADPRLPFGGSGESGFGRTRGEEGLLAMTGTQAIAVQRARRLRHTEPHRPGDEELFIGWLALAHGGSLGERWRGLVRMVRAAIRRPRASRSDEAPDEKLVPKETP